MILELLNIIFDSSELIIASYIIFRPFTGPITGELSGKLQFKTLIAGTGISMSQNSTSILVEDTNNKQGVGVTKNKVAMGTPGIKTGITASDISVAYCGLENVKLIGWEAPSVSLNKVYSSSGMIIGGHKNCISIGSTLSIIMGGVCNNVATSSYNIISSSFRSCITSTASTGTIDSVQRNLNYLNVIIGASDSCISHESTSILPGINSRNTIIGGRATKILVNDGCSNNNTLINSSICFRNGRRLTYIGAKSYGNLFTPYNYSTTVISSCNNSGNTSTGDQFFRKSSFSSILASNDAQTVGWSGSNQKHRFNTILSSLGSKICTPVNGTSSIGNFIASSSVTKLCYSCYSSSLSNSDFCVTNTNFSTIMGALEGTFQNSKHSFRASKNSTPYSTVLDSNFSILLNNGCLNNSNYSAILNMRFDDSKIFSSKNSIVMAEGQICNSTSGLIIPGITSSLSKICSAGSNSNMRSNVIFGSSNVIYSGLTSSDTSYNLIIGNCSNKIQSFTSSLMRENVILSGECNSINHSVNSGQPTHTRGNIINNARCSSIQGFCNSGIISSYKSYICDSCNSIIVGSSKSCIIGTDDSAIIGSYRACVSGRRSVIIGSTGSLSVDNTVKMSLVRIYGNVSHFCSVDNFCCNGINSIDIPSGKRVLSITIRRGIITSITTN